MSGVINISLFSEVSATAQPRNRATAQLAAEYFAADKCFSLSDATLSALDKSLSGAAKTFSVANQSFSAMPKVVSGPDKTPSAPGKSLAGTEKIVSDLDKTFSAEEKVLTATDKPLSGLDKVISSLEKIAENQQNILYLSCLTMFQFLTLNHQPSTINQ